MRPGRRFLLAAAWILASASSASRPSSSWALDEPPAADSDERSLKREERREERRRRREARRRERAARKLPEETEEEEERALEQEDKQRKTMTKARSLGEALKSQEQAEDLGSEPEVKGGAATAPPSGGDFSKPATIQELALASKTGLKSAFDLEGLRVGPGSDGRETVLRADGTPAGESELAALTARVASEPKALVGRPDFYAVLPREKFTQLKEDYRSPSRKAGPEFKHIGQTERERDFARSESCAPASGDCNIHARANYKKGEFVPPEDLSRIWGAIHTSPQEGPQGILSQTRPAASIRSRLSWVLDLANSFMGEQPSAATRAAPWEPARDERDDVSAGSTRAIELDRAQVPQPGQTPRVRARLGAAALGFLALLLALLGYRLWKRGRGA